MTDTNNQGKACANYECEDFPAPIMSTKLTAGDAHFHHYCYEGLPSRNGRSTSCPSCKVSFEELKPNYIGEKAIARAEDDYRGNKKRKRGRPSRAGASGDDEEEGDGEEEDEEEQELEEEEQPRRRSQGGTQVALAGAGPVGSLLTLKMSKI